MLVKDLHTRLYQQFLELCNQNTYQLQDRASSFSGSSSSERPQAASPSGFAVLDDLSAPLFVTDTVRLIDEVVQTIETEEQFLPILSAAYDPLLNHCRQMFPRAPAERAVFLVNCISLMVEPLATLKFAQDRVALYWELVGEQQQVLVEKQAAEVLDKLGLGEKLEALKKLERGPDGRQYYLVEKMLFEQFRSSNFLILVVWRCGKRSFCATFTSVTVFIIRGSSVGKGAGSVNAW